MTKHPFRFTFFLLMCLALPLTATAQVVDIPDPNLRAAVEAALGKASGATITVNEMARLTRLEARNAGIRDLTGLEHATNLTHLLLGEGESNSVSDLSPLSGLTNLTWLNLSRNNISDLSPVAGLTNLTGLNLGGNTLSNISPLAGLTNLRRLWLWDNNISDISPVAGLTNLIELILQSNAITDISPLSGLTNLTGLWLAYNTISDISPLVANTGLGSGDRVFVNDNPLSSASINTHIPTLENKGIKVEFDNQAHPALLKISGDNQTGASLAPLSQPFVIEAQDANGSTLAGVSVTFTVTEGGGTLSTTTTRTDENGRAQSTLTLGPNLGTNTVEVSATGIESLVTFYAISESLPLGVQGVQIYWAEGRTNSIRRANLDGTNVQDLITELGRPAAIALDVEGGKIYWTDIDQDKIQRANLDGTNVQEDGTNVQELVTGLEDPKYIA